MFFFNARDSRHPSDLFGKQDAARAKVTFPIDNSIHTAIKEDTNDFPGGETQYYNQYGIYSISDASITVAPQFLLPPGVPLEFRYTTGNVYKYEEYTVTGELGTFTAHRFIIPMNTISIPGDASSITLTVSMDLDGIIEQYDNKTSGNTADDVFVLAKDFWDRLAIGAAF